MSRKTRFTLDLPTWKTRFPTWKIRYVDGIGDDYLIHCVIDEEGNPIVKRIDRTQKKLRGDIGERSLNGGSRRSKKPSKIKSSRRSSAGRATDS